MSGRDQCHRNRPIVPRQPQYLPKPLLNSRINHHPPCPGQRGSSPVPSCSSLPGLSRTHTPGRDQCHRNRHGMPRQLQHPPKPRLNSRTSHYPPCPGQRGSSPAPSCSHLHGLLRTHMPGRDQCHRNRHNLPRQQQHPLKPQLKSRNYHNPPCLKLKGSSPAPSCSHLPDLSRTHTPDREECHRHWHTVPRQPQCPLRPQLKSRVRHHHLCPTQRGSSLQ